MLKALIVEDEAPARLELRYLLQPYQDRIQIVGEATNVPEAKALIDAIDYDVVFLDVSMPGATGMDLGAELKEKHPELKIVFVSAYDQYAVEAFSVQAVDYLLKPVSPERMGETVRRLLEVSGDNARPARPAQPPLEWVPCEFHGHTAPIAVSDIIYVVAERETIYVCTTDNRYPTRFTLGELEERLPDHFMRTHRSFIANLRQVREIMPYFNGTYLLKMKDKAQSEVIVSRSNVRRVKEIFNIA